MTKLPYIILAATAFNVSAMTEQECKPQALMAKELLHMAEDGLMPASREKIDFLRTAAEFVDKGEYCKARMMLLSSEKSNKKDEQ